MENPFISILLPSIGVMIGYYVKAILEKRKEYSSEVTRERRELYLKFVTLMVDIWKNHKTNKNQGKNNITKELFDFYKKYILYASPRVIKAFGDFMQYTYHRKSDENPKEYFSMITKVMLEMRKDLGLKNNSLGKNGELLMRALITDFDNMKPPF